MEKRLEIINQSAYQFIIEVHHQLDAICLPLYGLGISRFRYSKIYKNGNYLALDTSKEYIKQYLSLIKKPGSTFINQINQIKEPTKKVFLPNNNIKSFDKNQDPVIHLLYDNDLWNNLYILLSDNNEYVELIGFSMTRKDIDAPNFYLNNIKLLERFIEYFKDKAANLIDSKDKRKLAYFDQQFTFGSELTGHEFEGRVKKFLEETEVKNNTINGKNNIVRLAPREVECLQYLSLGHNVKQIASSVGLSPRTIEFYISNAKQKTGYHLKQKLINEFISQNLR